MALETGSENGVIEIYDSGRNVLPDRKRTPRNSIMLNHFSASNLSVVVNRNKTQVIKSKCFTLKKNGQMM